MSKTITINSTKLDWSIFFKAILTIALPIALQNLLSTTASMVDTIMIGSEGELSVAAVGICSQISSLFFSCYFGFAGGPCCSFPSIGEQAIKKESIRLLAFPFC